MQRIGIPITVMSLVIAALAVSPVLAQTGGAHLTRRGFPSCTISGDVDSESRTVRCSSELAGLGNEDLVITTLAEGETTFFCGAPGSGNLSPGQNRFPAEIAGDTDDPTVVPGAQLKNGRATASDFVTLLTPEDVTAEEAGCPNPRWQVVGSGLAITNVTYTVEQGDEILLSCEKTGTNLDDFTFARNECSGAAL